ncbi:MAG: DNA polymerase IV [Candidatus Liptonbacteria bacterium]|nr:DNA polymerase IV [Candidatus Liptonbacteria bacterium]
MRIIAHLDMDAFFASIEERDNPRLKGKPIVVGADPQDGRGRGVVSTANYAARAYGIRSALPISTAWRYSEIARRQGKAPAVFVEVNFKKYEEVSARVMDIVRKYSEAVEEASVDEAYVDLSFTDSYNAAENLCQKIKSEIKDKERLTASVGIGPNKLIAKIASDMKKPDGLTVVREEDAEKFLELLPVRKIPGVGPKTEAMFSARGIKIVRDAKKFSQEELRAMLGKWGGELYEKVRGRDDSPIVTDWEAKSIGEQETFEKDSDDPNFLSVHLMALAEAVFVRFEKSDFSTFRTVTITVRFGDFTTKTRSMTLKNPVRDLATLKFEALKLFMPFLDKRENPGRKPVRLLGARIEKLN